MKTDMTRIEILEANGIKYERSEDLKWSILTKGDIVVKISVHENKSLNWIESKFGILKHGELW
jgi:hypothetical protein